MSTNIESESPGVEEEVQMNYLLENGCDKLQGYLIGRPLDEETAIALLEKERPGV